MRSIAIAAWCLAAAASAQVRHYEILPAAASRLELHVYKTGIYKGKSHLFLFEQYRCALDYDPRNPESSRVRLTIAASGAKLMDTWLSAKDLKSVQDYALKDMLAADRFPEITFVSSQVRAVNAGFDVEGMLTIRGIAKPSTVHVTIEPGGGFRGDAKIRLTNYGLKPPSAALGLIGTKDEMDFMFTLAVN